MGWIVPGLMLLFLLWGFAAKVDVYGAFTRGAMEALPLLGRILPFMAAMLCAISAFRACGALAWVEGKLAPLLSALGFPPALIPMLVLRPFSGGAGMALLADVYQSRGVDSFEGFAASLMLGSTETIFYVLALYCGAVGVRKSRYTLPVALFCTAVGAAASVWLAGLWVK